MRLVTTAMLTEENRDGTVGRMCPCCGFQLQLGDDSWGWKPVAVVNAPWSDSAKIWAIVKECPECFALCWSHGTDDTKKIAEELGFFS